jgi:crotonobetainyl-CoA:carnitine CoA-transferase CaiB-like acyl-CoA transferase
MPMRPGVQSADVFGALFATYATLAGLVGAARHGEGRIVDLSLVEASIAAAAWEAAEYLETGKVPQPLGNKHRLSAPYQLFETRDGRYLAIGTPNDQLFGKLMQVLGLASHVADPRFASYASRKLNEDALLPLVEPAVRSRDSKELEQALMVAGVPCARVNNFKEVSRIRALARCAPPAIRFCSITTGPRSTGTRPCSASIPRRCWRSLVIPWPRSASSSHPA